MKSELFKENSPEQFWAITPPCSDELWQDAVSIATGLLNLPSAPNNRHDLISYILGEDRYGENVWKLSSLKRLYYILKPILPRSAIYRLRHLYHLPDTNNRWFIDDRYAKFLWTVLEYVVSNAESDQIRFKALWPHNKRFAFTLTHDIEDSNGQKAVRELADIDEEFGFRSAFFFVPERYPLDYDLIKELKDRGFEIGIHGLKHDGKLYFSQESFNARADKINCHIDRVGAVGFSSPFTHRHAVWLQQLNIEYDRSFFDIDLYEPMPGGVMTIWPYQLGKFIELPYTLLQDYTLTQVMNETTPAKWIEKLQFIRQYRGMALLNTHPDYLKSGNAKQVYIEFLSHVRDMDDYWHALPREVASWWRYRKNADDVSLTTINSAMIDL